jgi:subtilisin-like proprotein convertase family protein
LATNTSFVLTVSSLTVGTRSFTNAAAITIPGSGVASLYPSAIIVSNLGGTVSNMTVSVRGLSHTRPDDIDMLLVGPGGQKAILFADAGGANILTNVNVTLSDTATSALPNNNRINSGTYRPSNYSPADTLPSPAPASPYAGALSAFTGQTPNGVWSLYVFDDQSGSAGSIASGWSLTLTTAGAVAARVVVPPAPITITDIGFVDPSTVRIAGAGDAGAVYTVETSVDLIRWDALGQTIVDDSGAFEFVDDLVGGSAQRFYRVTLP